MDEARNKLCDRFGLKRDGPIADAIQALQQESAKSGYRKGYMDRASRKEYDEGNAL